MHSATERASKEAVTEMNEALRESTKLLLKSRPPRPAIPHDHKLLQAAAIRATAASGGGLGSRANLSPVVISTWRFSIH